MGERFSVIKIVGFHIMTMWNLVRQSFIPCRGKYWSYAVTMRSATKGLPLLVGKPKILWHDQVQLFHLIHLAALVSFLLLSDRFFVPKDILLGFGFGHLFSRRGLDGTQQ